MLTYLKWMVLLESFFNLFISVSNTSFEKKVVLDQ